MKRCLMRLMMVFTVCLWPFAAHAGIAELPEEELLEASDLVAEVKVTETACDGPVQTDSNGNVITRYVSQLEVLAVTKAEAIEAGAIVTYKVSVTDWNDEFGAPLCASPEVVLPVGWVGTLYLYESSDGSFALQFQNGAVKDPDKSVIEELPVCEPDEPGASSGAGGGAPGSPDPESNEPAGAGGGTNDGKAVLDPSGGCSVSEHNRGTAPFGFALIGFAFWFSRRRFH